MNSHYLENRLIDIELENEYLKKILELHNYKFQATIIGINVCDDNVCLSEEEREEIDRIHSWYSLEVKKERARVFGDNYLKG